jgi:NADH-quinone oxidoreductase subunit C
MPPPDREAVREALRLRFGAVDFALGLELPREALLQALRLVRDEHGYRYYVCASATDREAEIEVVHGVRELGSNDELWLKVRLAKTDLTIPSATAVFAGADWHEREILDLFGVEFHGHPDPRRILMPDEYPGHPLLKSFRIDTPWGYRPETRVEGE